MRELLKRLFPQGSFLRNVSILTGGTAAAQGLAVLALPLLTRFYSPEDFALLAVYVAVTSIISVVSCLRYDVAIPLPEDDADAMALMLAALSAAMAISILIAFPVLLFPNLVATLLGQSGLATYLWMVPIGVIFSATYDSLQYWASRKARFTLVARTRIARAVGGVGTQLTIGSVAPSPFGLILGQLFNGVVGIWSLAHKILKSDREVWSRVGWARVRKQATRYRRFPIWAVPESFVNTASQELPIILIATIAAGPEAGFLFLAMRMMAVPVQLIGSSVAQVFLTEAPARMREGRLSLFTQSTVLALLKAGAPPLLMIGLLSPILFPLVFGADWERAGWLMAWMTPWFLLQFIVSPVSMVLIVLERMKLAFALQVFGLVIRTMPIIAAGATGLSNLSEIFAVSSAVFYAVYLLIVLGMVRSRARTH